jgi:lysylphosphatidylglycerol synthetase-like protein (DUF2156 family)
MQANERRHASRPKRRAVKSLEGSVKLTNGETLMQWLFLIAAILGTILPLTYFFPFAAAHGLDMRQFFQQLFQNNISAFFGMDVIVSAFALFIFIFAEGRRRGMKNLWAYVLCTLIVGVSLGLPLFLFFRERKLSAEKHA